MALGSTGAISLGGPSTGQSIALELGLSATATISLNDTVVRTLGGVASGQISLNTFYGKSAVVGTQKAIFAYGRRSASPYANMSQFSNLVSSSGVVAADLAIVGTTRQYAGSASYGGDKGIFMLGAYNQSNQFQVTNLVSNTGVIAADTPVSATPRWYVAAAGYGTDKAICAFGFTPALPLGSTGRNTTNLISNTGVMASDTANPTATARSLSTGVTYGTDKAIICYGLPANLAPTFLSSSNLISNAGVVAADTPIVGTARGYLGSSSYGTDKAILGYGQTPIVSITNLVSNTGVVASDTPGVGTARSSMSAVGYGLDKGIFLFGGTPTNQSMSNLVSNTGVVASDTPTVAQAKQAASGAGYSSSA